MFRLVWVNPENEHGGELLAILDGLQLLGVYESFGADISLRGSKIEFACTADEWVSDAYHCKTAGFQAIDLAEPKLPETLVIEGLVTDLSDSI